VRKGIGVIGKERYTSVHSQETLIFLAGGRREEERSNFYKLAL